jgi:glycerol uptake facilitator-like aquaporin
MVFGSAYFGLSPLDAPLPAFSPTTGPFGTVNFLGPLIGSTVNVFLLWVAILAFGPITGGHLNPFLTIATFCIRLTSLPRAILYIFFQLVGGALAGLLLRASWGGRDFKVGGCFLFEGEKATVGGAMAVEFVGCLSTIILAFGVGIDPRNKQLLGPVLAPFLIGLTVGTLILSLSFSIPGYGGPAMHPARCFGVYVGSRFWGYHWVHWVGPIAASIAHAIMYALVPPWELRGNVEEVKVQPGAMGMVKVKTGEQPTTPACVLPRPHSSKGELKKSELV